MPVACDDRRPFRRISAGKAVAGNGAAGVFCATDRRHRPRWRSPWDGRGRGLWGRGVCWGVLAMLLVSLRFLRLRFFLCLTVGLVALLAEAHWLAASGLIRVQRLLTSWRFWFAGAVWPRGIRRCQASPRTVVLRSPPSTPENFLVELLAGSSAWPLFHCSGRDFRCDARPSAWKNRASPPTRARPEGSRASRTMPATGASCGEDRGPMGHLAAPGPRILEGGLVERD